MADNKFTITITAVDKATKVVNAVNKNVSKVFRPYDNAKRSLKSFSDALGRNELISRPLAGLKLLGTGITNVSSAFGIAETGILGSSARIAGALGSFGGPIGGLLAGTAAVAGSTLAVSAKMATLGLDVERTAKSLNISTRTLQEYRGAAKMAGLETESMDNALSSLGDTLQESEFGRNPQVATALALMHVQIKRTKDGAVDTVAALRDISGVVQNMSDQVLARKLTDMLGITELLPLLREGTGKIDEYRAAAQRLGMVVDEDVIRRNVEQAESWHQTKSALEGAAVSIGNVIAKYGHLREVSEAASAAAERLQKEGPSWRMLAENVFNNAPQAWLLRKIFGDASSSGTGGSRSASGPVTDASGPAAPTGSNVARGIRNNNPGNLRSWQGAGQDGGGFARFATPELGIMAMAKNLASYQDRYGINTIRGIVNRWAPAGDGNDPRAYAAQVSKQTGFGVNEQLNLHDPKTVQALVGAIVRQENGQNPYSPEQLARAIADAMQQVNMAKGEQRIRLEVVGLPPGLQIRPVQPSVGLTMAPGGTS